MCAGVWSPDEEGQLAQLVGAFLQKVGTYRVQMGAGRCVPSDFKPSRVKGDGSSNLAKLSLDGQGPVRVGSGYELLLSPLFLPLSQIPPECMGVCRPLCVAVWAQG